MVTRAWSITTVSGYLRQGAVVRLVVALLADPALVVMPVQGVAVAAQVAVSRVKLLALSGAVALLTASLLSGNQ